MAICEKRVEKENRISVALRHGKRCVVLNNSDDACQRCLFPKAACICAKKECPMCDRSQCICD